MVAYLLSVAVAGELQRVPATRTHSINGTETVIPEQGWMVVDDEGRRVGPAEFALAVGDTDTLALLDTVQKRRDRRGVTLMLVGLSAAAGGGAAVGVGSQQDSVLMVQAGLGAGLGGFVTYALGRRLTRTLHPAVNELDEIYTADEVDAWLATAPRRGP